MTWAFKYVGNKGGIIDAMDKGGGQYDRASGRLVVPYSYERAVREIVNHITDFSEDIGWQVEAWGGSESFHIDVQPVNLRVRQEPPVAAPGKETGK